MTRSRQYLEAKKKITSEKKYTLEEAAELIPQLSTSKFEGKIELHLHLSLKEKEVVKGSFSLPHQVGEAAKVCVITSPKNQKSAQEAGAEKVGFEEIIKEIEKGKIDFDVLIATPEVMPKIAHLGKTLGPKGLMPSPKHETVTDDLEKAVKSFKAGKINYKSDAGGNIHLVIGTVKSTKEQLIENIRAALKNVVKNVKSISSVNTISISPTMGPGVRLDLAKIIKELT